MNEQGRTPPSEAAKTDSENETECAWQSMKAEKHVAESLLSCQQLIDKNNQEPAPASKMLKRRYKMKK